MKINNCPICNSEILKENIKDCGYNIFNVGNISCKCGYEIEFKNLNSEEEYIKAWNLNSSSLEEILSLKEEEKNLMLIELFQKKSIEMIEALNIINLYKEHGDEINKTLEIIKKEKLDLNISKDGCLEVPENVNEGFLKYLKEHLNIKLKIKFVKKGEK